MSSLIPTLAQRFAALLAARENTIKSDNTAWFLNHSDAILELVGDYMPSGSGFDAGTQIDFDKSTPERIVFHAGFHHMDENGTYDGWTEHDVIVTPSLVHGFNLRVTGRGRNQIKDYIAETFTETLNRRVVTS